MNPDQKQTLMDVVREESMRVAGALLKSAVGLLFMLGLVGIGSITGLRENTVAPVAVISPVAVIAAGDAAKVVPMVRDESVVLARFDRVLNKHVMPIGVEPSNR